MLIAASFFTAYAMARAAAWDLDLGLIVFIAWAVSPYLVFFTAGRVLKRFVPSAGLSYATLAIALLMLAFTVMVYAGINQDPSSTASLIFVFAPLYIYIGSFFLLTVSVIVMLIFGRKSSRPN